MKMTLPEADGFAEPGFKPYWNYDTCFRGNSGTRDVQIATEEPLSYDEIVKRLNEQRKLRGIPGGFEMLAIHGRIMTNARGLMSVSYTVTKSERAAEAAKRQPGTGLHYWFYPDPSKPEWEILD